MARERAEDEQVVTNEPPIVEGQATENPADEAKILSDQDETRELLEAGVADLEDRPGERFAGDSEEFLEGDLDVSEMMERRMRDSEAAVRRRDYKPDAIKRMDKSTEDKATPPTPTPHGERVPEVEPPGQDPLPRP